MTSVPHYHNPWTKLKTDYLTPATTLEHYPIGNSYNKTTGKYIMESDSATGALS